MSDARTIWKEDKKRLKNALEPALGKGWFDKNFKQDLGPTLDKWYAAEVDTLKNLHRLEVLGQSLHADKFKTPKDKDEVLKHVEDNIEKLIEKRNQFQKLGEQVLKTHGNYLNLLSNAVKAEERNPDFNRSRFPNLIKTVSDIFLKTQDLFEEHLSRETNRMNAAVKSAKARLKK